MALKVAMATADAEATATVKDDNGSSVTALAWINGGNGGNGRSHDDGEGW